MKNLLSVLCLVALVGIASASVEGIFLENSKLAFGYLLDDIERDVEVIVDNFAENSEVSEEVKNQVLSLAAPMKSIAYFGKEINKFLPKVLSVLGELFEEDIDISTVLPYTLAGIPSLLSSMKRDVEKLDLEAQYHSNSRD